MAPELELHHEENTQELLYPASSQPIGARSFEQQVQLHGDKLWADDFATGATKLVDEIDPGPNGSDPRDFVARDGQLYFAANDGNETGMSPKSFQEMDFDVSLAMLSSALCLKTER
jgi:ELWxxDGT repeat protein